MCMKLIIKLEMLCVDTIYVNVQSLEDSTKLLLVVAYDYFCPHLESFSSITVFYIFFILGLFAILASRCFILE